MNGQAWRHWVWLALLWFGSVSGLWAGVTRGFPPAVFAMLACWVLGLTWLVASARAS